MRCIHILSWSVWLNGEHVTLGNPAFSSSDSTLSQYVKLNPPQAALLIFTTAKPPFTALFSPISVAHEKMMLSLNVLPPECRIEEGDTWALDLRSMPPGFEPRAHELRLHYAKR